MFFLLVLVTVLLTAHVTIKYRIQGKLNDVS